MFFSGFPGMGGFGGGSEESGDSGDDSGSTNNKRYYEIIGVEKTATQQEITKAYRKKALQLHPDKHPDEKDKYQALFQELQEAYEVLNDPDKRKLYDRFGEAGLKGSSQSSMGDIFDVFFGGRGGRGGAGGRGGNRQKKAPVIKLPLDVTLEDLFIGATKDVEYKRFTLCRKCEGKGGSKVIECSGCDGRGMVIQVQRMGNMTLQQQRPCPKCSGEGTMIKDSDKCKQCEGKGLKELKETIQVTIPVGTQHAEQVIMRGRGHEIPDQANGDVVFIVRCDKHEIFTRVGADLAMNYTLSLKEALCGFDIRVRHLSGKTLRVKSKPGDVVQHEELKVLYGQGMPQKGNPQVKGHLYIKFKIKLPDSLTDEMVAQIKELLPEEKKDEEMKDKDEKKTDKKTDKSKTDGTKESKTDGTKTEGTKTEEEEEEEDHGPIETHVEASSVEGTPAVTPASSKSAYDEDEEENQGVSCRHM